MPFRYLNNRYQFKLMRSNIVIPISVLVIGFLLSTYSALSVYNHERKNEYSDMSLMVQEYSKQFELNILNNTLKVQSLTDIIGGSLNKFLGDRLVVDQILKNSIFQRISVYRYVKTNETDLLPILQRVNFSHIKNDTLPKPSSDYLESKYLRKKIKMMIEDGKLSSFTFTEGPAGEFVVLIWKVSGEKDKYALFNAPLKSFIDESVTSPRGLLLLEDAETDFKILLSWIEDGKFKIIKGSDIDQLQKNSEAVFLFANYIKAVPSLSFKWFMAKHSKVNFFAWVILFSGVFITLLLSTLLRFILNQNKLVSNLVINRTEDLETALNEATEANLAKTRFLGNMSHELRTPLNLILGMLELIEEKNQDQKIHEYLKSIRVSGDHLLRLISDLLEMARQDSRAVTIKNAPIKFPLFLEEIYNLITPDITKKGLDFHLRISPDVPDLVSGDPARLRQILMNLIRNSIKYTLNGSVTLIVSVWNNKNIDKNQSRKKIILRFEIIDTGIGIPQSKQVQIFERFLQLESSKVLSQGGVGLGLSIVKDLVTALNGNISVKSDLGQGSTFTVDLDFEVLNDSSWLSSFETDIRHKIAIISDKPCFNEDIKACFGRFPVETVVYSKEEFSRGIQNLENSDFTDFIVENFEGMDLSCFNRVKRSARLILMGPVKQTEVNNLNLNVIFLDRILVTPSIILSSLGFKKIKITTQSEMAESQKIVNYRKKEFRKNIKVLIADDDQGNRQLFEAYLHDFGWSLFFAENGREAFTLYCDSKPELVIADLRMPIMDGFELTDRIRDYESINQLNRVPIILVTADALEKTEEIANDRGINSFLTKPLRKSKLIDALMNYLS